VGGERFGFASFGGNPSYECIGVSQTSIPVAGGWFLYAVLVDPPMRTISKAAMWSDPQLVLMAIILPRT